MRELNTHKMREKEKVKKYHITTEHSYIDLNGNNHDHNLKICRLIN